jgi:chaperonin GroES
MAGGRSGRGVIRRRPNDNGSTEGGMGRSSSSAQPNRHPTSNEGFDLMAATKTKSKKKAAKKSTNLQPIGERIVVEREESLSTTAGGIFLPESAKDKPSRGTVISVGTGKLLKDGTRGEMQLKPGDKVLFTSYGPDEIKLGDEEYLLMREDDVLAVIE